MPRGPWRGFLRQAKGGITVTARLAEKRILVTGASGAIGAATAHRLAGEGALLALADLRAPDRTADEIAQELGARPETFGYDARAPDDSTALVSRAVAALGGLDGVCNIAGVYAKVRSTDITPEDWHRSLTINLTSAFLICRAAIPYLAQTGGSVVNTSSLAALEGLAYSTAYATAKAGVIAMTKSLAAEYASAGVRFNAICPGGIRSGMSVVAPVPDADPDLTFRRSKLKGFDGLGEPSDIAAGFAYLLSPDARFVSGTALVIDGAQFLI